MAAFTSLLFFEICCLIQCHVVLNAPSGESGETESIHFYYDSHTHMMIVTRQATCYIFVLTQDEQTLVHSDTGLRHIELALLQQISDPNLQLTTVPKLSLHQNILRDCGKNIVQYHIIQ